MLLVLKLAFLYLAIAIVTVGLLQTSEMFESTRQNRPRFDFALYVHLFTSACFVGGSFVVNALTLEEFAQGLESQLLKFMTVIAPCVWIFVIGGFYSRWRKKADF